MTNPNDPINPIDYSMKDSKGNKLTQGGGDKGLTKREYFAAMAMTAAEHFGSNDGKYMTKAPDLAKSCVAYADALIAELNKEPKS